MRLSEVAEHAESGVRRAFLVCFIVGMLGMLLAATENKTLVAIAKLVVPVCIFSAVVFALIAAIFVWHRFLLERKIVGHDPEFSRFLKLLLPILCLGALLGVAVRFEGALFLDALAGALLTFPLAFFLALLFSRD